MIRKSVLFILVFLLFELAGFHQVSQAQPLTISGVPVVSAGTDVDQGSTSAAPEIFCYQIKPKVPQSVTITSAIDMAFGGVVNFLAKVLFWQPVEFTVTDAKGRPLRKTAPVLNAHQKPLEVVSLLVRHPGEKKPKYDTATACLDENGEIRTNSEGLPWVTTWRLSHDDFAHATPFVRSGVEYPKDGLGKFYTKTGLLEKLTSEPQKNGIPLVVLILFFGAIFYTIYYRFINFRMFKHAIDCVRGVFTDPKEPGEMSHFQALTTALSATVGLGNIAGVAVAVGLGGPGAVFWMILLGFLGMSSKFHECTLGQMYRTIDEEGHVHGGAMYYLSKGFGELGLANLGRVLALLFALFTIGGALGAGNMFQANQSFKAMAGELPFLTHYGWAFGLFLAFMVGLVIIGGIRRIANVTDKLVPFMCGIYVLAALWVVITHFAEFPHVMRLIFAKAFTFEAGVGGFVGVAVQGIRRAVFSNEAGAGSAAIAHSCARTKEPVREGMVSLLEPFIDTVVICTMTAFVILVTGAYDNPMAGEGVQMARYAFSTKLSWFPAILSVSVLLFAYSTMISWSYYGEIGWTYLLGHGRATVLTYRFLFLFFTVFGCMMSLGNVLDFSDFMFLSMVFPNIAGGIWLSRKVKRRLNDYMAKLKAGEFVRYK